MKKNIYKILGVVFFSFAMSLFLFNNSYAANCAEKKDGSGKTMYSFVLNVEDVVSNQTTGSNAVQECIYLSAGVTQLDFGTLSGELKSAQQAEGIQSLFDLGVYVSNNAWVEYYKDGKWESSKKIKAQNLIFDVRGDYLEKRYVIDYSLSASSEKKYLRISFSDLLLSQNEVFEPVGCCATLEDNKPVYKEATRPQCTGGDWSYLECQFVISIYLDQAEACYCNIDGVNEKRIIIGLTSANDCQKSRSDFEGFALTECEWIVPPKDQATATSSASTFPSPKALNILGTADVKIIIGRAIQTGMRIIGSIALAMFIYGGATWMIGRGNAEKTKKATEIMVWASLGVMVILGSYALVDFVFEAFR